MIGKRTNLDREKAYRLYAEGRSDYEIANCCAVSIFTVESWKRIYNWRRRRVDYRLEINAGIPGFVKGSYSREWTEDEADRPRPETKTRSGRRGVGGKGKTYAKKALAYATYYGTKEQLEAKAGGLKAPCLRSEACKRFIPCPDKDDRYDRPDVRESISAAPGEDPD